MQLLILSDVHGNWPALQAVVAAEPRVDGVICLGDLVNYGPHPSRDLAACVPPATARQLTQVLLTGGNLATAGRA